MNRVAVTLGRHVQNADGTARVMLELQLRMPHHQGRATFGRVHMDLDLLEGLDPRHRKLELDVGLELGQR